MAYDIYAQINAEKVESMLKHFTYKEGWAFSIFAHTSHYGSLFELRISVNVKGTNSLVGDKTAIQMLTNTWFPILGGSMDDREIERWLLDCVMFIEQYGMCKHFKIGGKAIFYPEHRDGVNSYRIMRKV